MKLRLKKYLILIFSKHHIMKPTIKFQGPEKESLVNTTQILIDKINNEIPTLRKSITEVRLMLIESDKDLDNKEMYESLIKKIKTKLSKYSKYIDVNFSFENSKKYKYTKKSGFFSKPKELCYSVYVLSVRIKRKKVSN